MGIMPSLAKELKADTRDLGTVIIKESWCGWLRLHSARELDAGHREEPSSSHLGVKWRLDERRSQMSHLLQEGSRSIFLRVLSRQFRSVEKTLEPERDDPG